MTSTPLEKKYIIQRDANPRNMKCTLCDSNITGTLTRVRNHYLGGPDVKICSVTVDNPIYAQFLSQIRSKYELKTIASASESSNRAKVQRSLTQFGSFSTSTHSPTFTEASQSENQVSQSQRSLKAMWKPQEKHEVDRLVARFFYANAIPFNVVRNSHTKAMVEGITNFGKGYTMPSSESLRTVLLEDEMTSISSELDKMKKLWKKSGCTIISDGWSDTKRRPLLNILTQCPKGSMFIKSIDTSNEVKTADFIFKCIESAIVDIGEEYVVQVITDNAANCKAAGELLMDRFPHLFWTPCATHVLDLLLEDLAKLEWVNSVVREGKQISKFILNHRLTLSLYRSYAKRELLSPAETRFASNFITLQREVEERTALRRVVISEEWVQSKLSKESTAKDIERIILGSSFWEGAEKTLKVFEPLVRLLRLADGIKPCISFVYEGMEQAKEQIKKTLPDEGDEVQRIWDIVDIRWNMLHRPIHAAGCYLNPKLIEVDHDSDEEVKNGVLATIDRLVQNENEKPKVRRQLTTFKNQEGMFSLKEAQEDIGSMDPHLWWQTYGSSTPELQKLAVRVHSQCASSSACERNWSTHDLIHTNKRNRLGAKKLSDLVFVHSNLRLLEHNLTKEDDELLLGEPSFEGVEENIDSGDDLDRGFTDSASASFDFEAGFNVANV